MSADTMEGGEELHKSCPNMCSDFAFAFDNPAFSDRVLKLLIFDETAEEKSKNVSTEKCKLNDLLGILKQRKEEIPESPREHRVKSLNVSSVILAAKSQFFCKLFTNGMKASDQHEVNLRIHSSEESALMDMFKFMYNKNLLSANTPNALMEVLVAADKYDVPSCVNYCCTLLLSFPMTAELTLFYIDLPSLIPLDAIRPLIKAAKNFLPVILKDISKYYDDIIKLSLDGIKLILSRDDLKVESEDKAYDLLVGWSKERCHDSEERYRVLKAEMFDLIRFQHVSSQKLNSIVNEFYTHNNLDPVVVSSLIGAIIDDSKPSFPKHRRSYSILPVKVVTFEIPNQHCVVYLDLKREECEDIEKLKSESFTLLENVFYLVFQRRKHETKDDTFAMYLWLEKTSKRARQVKYEFLVRRKSSPKMFTSQAVMHSAQTFKEGSGRGLGDLFSETWDIVMAEDSEYLINGTLHLKVNVSLEDSEYLMAEEV